MLWQRARRAIGAQLLAVLDLLGRPEVPVYTGADRPLQATEPYTPPASTALIHGKNGIGGASVPASPYEPVGATSADGNAAVDYLIDAARTYGPDLVYVATGPLSTWRSPRSAMRRR